MNFERKRKYLTSLGLQPPSGEDKAENAKYARGMLSAYHTGINLKIAPSSHDDEFWLKWYDAYSILTCEGMGDSHKMDSKRDDRRRGRDMRTDRAGSRRG